MVSRSYFDAEGKEKVSENYVTHTILVNEGKKLHIFKEKVDFIKYVFDAMGIEPNRIFYNSLSTPFFVSEALPDQGKGDVLFWQEDVRPDIPGNMQIILNGQSTRTKTIYVQKKASYEKLIELGASSEVVKPLGFVYSFKKENQHSNRLLICTNSDQIEKLPEMVMACADMVPKILALPFIPSSLEFVERELIDIVEKNLHKLFPVKEGDACLIVMYEANSQQELDAAVDACCQAALENGAIDCAIADTPERAASVWGVRGAILEGMKADSVSQEECDVVVPRSCIAEYVKQAKKIASKYGLRVEPCGHCGDGNIHTELLRGPEQSDLEWKHATHAALTELYVLAKELGGQMSGEHGTGNGRLSFLKDFVGDRMIDLYKQIKIAFDPNLILNPGKMIEFNEEDTNEK